MYDQAARGYPHAARYVSGVVIDTAIPAMTSKTFSIEDVQGKTVKDGGMTEKHQLGA